jgi:SAM-dependent methyltransferase
VKTHDYERFAMEYAGLGIEGTYYLAFRDVPALLGRHVHGTKALDYGCGPGRSTRFLKSLGFETIGVDISPDMLGQAKENDESGKYLLIQSGRLPFDDTSFDVVFSSFVFIEVPTSEEIVDIIKEMKRVTKLDGHIVIITSPEDCYKGNWVSFCYDFPENKRDIQSGETVKLLIQGTGVVLYDYYWTENDYSRVFRDVGLGVTEVLKPLGADDDPVEWSDERRTGGMLIYMLEREDAAADGQDPGKPKKTRANKKATREG